MLELLALIVIANSAPVLARHLCGARFAAPVDGGRLHADGRPLLGRSKTWRGLVAGALASTLLAPLLGVASLLGLATGALALTGDLLASYAKRRRGHAPSAQAPLLDSVPEALLPALVLRDAFALDWLDVALVTAAFHVIVRGASPLLYRLGLRRRPW
ncbi:MAG: CDP-archaeol synthase [Gammaproteobacteria bacterium]